MIINPIIPIWLMIIICLVLTILVIHNKELKEKISSKTDDGEKTARQKELQKNYIISASIKISCIILLFIINLRFMIPNGENTILSSEFNILFVIDTSVSMRALDYDKDKERFEGVINDCCYIIDQLPGCKFSIITFGNSAQRLIPFTNDTDMVQAELKSINVEHDYFAKGTSINIVKDIFENTLKQEKERQNNKAKFITFFITDGEITKEEKLESFANIAQNISNGAVLGYGTEKGGKMVNSMFANDPSNEDYYMYYYDENYKKNTSISKIDEKTLKQLSTDLKIDYIKMDNTAKIDYKLNNIKDQIFNSQTTEEKINSYQDIYYYFAIPLVILLIAEFILKKRRMQ